MSGQRLQEIHGVFVGERFRFENAGGDVVVGDAELVNGSKSDEFPGFVTIKGPADSGELIYNQTYSFYGKWSTYKNRRTGEEEKQFHFSTFVQQEPAGRWAISAYLAEAGKGKGIGRARALKIYDRFGEDSIRVAREQPEKIHDLTGVTLDQCQQIAEWLQDRQKLEQVTLRVNGLLAGKGFPKPLAKRVINAWGNLAERRIKQDPYCLMQFPGVGFLLCDKLFLELGGRPDRLRRQAYSAWYTCASSNDGHTWFPVSFVAGGVMSRCGINSDPVRAIKMGRKIGQIRDDRHGALATIREDAGAVVESGDEVWISEGRKANNEARLAKRVAKAMTEPHNWPEVDQVENIDDHQRQALREALQGSIAILGGGPGTGKTFASANLIRLLIEKIGHDLIAVAAPTGKAAVRISEAMEANGISLRAKTWHSLLGVGEINAVTGNWSFRHCPADPWKFQVIVGDESSMIDTDLMQNIFAARAIGTHVLLVGDVNQLPPVGHGAPLRDMIAAGIPYGELTEIKRNSGGIVEACAAIRQGKPWGEGDNLRVWE